MLPRLDRAGRVYGIAAARDLRRGDRVLVSRRYRRIIELAYTADGGVLVALARHNALPLAVIFDEGQPVRTRTEGTA